MNYRHLFHAGNFADVMKHVLLGQLIHALQRKEKGFLILDTHSGRGIYDLTRAETGQTLKRAPEHPGGIGCVIAAAGGAGAGWARRAARDDQPDPGRRGAPALPPADNPPRGPSPSSPVPAPLPAAIAEYRELVRNFDQAQGNLDGPLRYYPGSPWIARRLMRPQDRLALCELQEDECLALRAAFAGEARTAVHELDGYTALRAMLPPPEKRALVLIDPPYEAQDEWARVAAGLGEALKRFPSGVYAVWYPLTERARLDVFADEFLQLRPPPTLVAELEIAGEAAGLRLRGCGLVIVNPPWQFEAEARPVLDWMARELAQAPGATFTLRWLVPE
jgi:23S rRNA (adenine2030-N6)-methyltransferase